MEGIGIDLVAERDRPVAGRRTLVTLDAVAGQSHRPSDAGIGSPCARMATSGPSADGVPATKDSIMVRTVGSGLLGDDRQPVAGWRSVGQPLHQRVGGDLGVGGEARGVGTAPLADQPNVPDHHRRVDALIEGGKQHRLPPVGLAPVQQVLSQGRRRGTEHPPVFLLKDAAARRRRTGGDPGVVRRGHRQTAGAVGTGLEQQGVGTQPAPAARYRWRQRHRHLFRRQIRLTGSRDHRLG